MILVDENGVLFVRAGSEPLNDYYPDNYNLSTRPTKQVVDAVEYLLDDLMSHVNEAAGKTLLRSITVYFTKRGALGSDIARYIDGTPNDVFIMVDATRVSWWVKKGVDILDGVDSTLAHEVAHAIQESSGLPYDEDQAEEFARKYTMLRVVWPFWERRNY